MFLLNSALSVKEDTDKSALICYLVELIQSDSFALKHSEGKDEESSGGRETLDTCGAGLPSLEHFNIVVWTK
ncbi:hypothetical protein DPMN_086805 [Dreissena polymorpha]|uniref:Uncharacterized protein n=1 Tax=Dreissena polymorpha TaxID=45954 RepID=A0A9D4QUX1_DREPO|nr:hypothetical protein DPMN_086805 [Dreissena polymorpha]